MNAFLSRLSLSPAFHNMCCLRCFVCSVCPEMASIQGGCVFCPEIDSAPVLLVELSMAFSFPFSFVRHSSGSRVWVLCLFVWSKLLFKGFKYIIYNLLIVLLFFEIIHLWWPLLSYSLRPGIFGTELGWKILSFFGYCALSDHYECVHFACGRLFYARSNIAGGFTLTELMHVSVNSLVSWNVVGVRVEHTYSSGRVGLLGRRRERVGILPVS